MKFKRFVQLLHSAISYVYLPLLHLAYTQEWSRTVFYCIVLTECVSCVYTHRSARGVRRRSANHRHDTFFPLRY